jgi:hypothetical protein
VGAVTVNMSWALNWAFDGNRTEVLKLKFINIIILKMV